MFVVKLQFIPSSCEFIPVENSDRMNVAVSEEKSGRIFVIDPAGEREKSVEMGEEIVIDPFEKETAENKEVRDNVVNIMSSHMHPVKFLKMNWKFGVCVSVDERANV